jgi:heterodisulfide reductase subunit C
VSPEIPADVRGVIEAKAQLCFGCGVCMGGCPVARVNEGFHPRRLVRELVLSDWEDVLRGGAIWLCAQCHLCNETCPQGVGISDLIVELRNLATDLGVSPPGAYIENIRTMTKTGRLTKPASPTSRARSKLNLGDLEPAGAEEIRKLVRGTRFEGLIADQEGE